VTDASLQPTPSADVHPLLRSRFSPVDFDAAHRVGQADVDLLLDAARWAPSAGNSQPWAFVTALRGTPKHQWLLGHLAPSSHRWAQHASVLVVCLAHRYVEDSDIAYSEFADYDLGQAVAHLTLQAGAMGLAARQFRAFDLDALTAELWPDPGWAVVSMVAVGRAAEGPAPQRTRNGLDQLRSAPFTGPVS
jgi:nitroreductase